MTPPVDAALRAALAEAAQADRLLVALDFDGTLAPLVDDPADSRALPGAIDAIRDLITLPRTVVAVISGRGLESLDEVGGMPQGVLLVGSHGAQLRLTDGHDRSALTEADLARRESLSAILAEAADVAGVWIEEKPTGFAVHTRLATPDDGVRAHDQARRAVEAAGLEGITMRAGKQVLEFSVVAATKGDAIELLRAESGADVIVFAGDDVTDEDGFLRLRGSDIGIKCGAGSTAASHRVADPEGVVAALHSMVEARRTALAGPGATR